MARLCVRYRRSTWPAATFPSGAMTVCARLMLRHPSRVPDPAHADERPAAGLSRQRGHHAKAARRDRRHRALLRNAKRQHPPRRLPLARRHGRVRSRPREGAAFLNAREAARNHLHPRHHRGHQPRRRQLGPRKFLKPGDEIVISAMEHHSNIVPWQMVCRATGAKLRVIPINDAGELMIGRVRQACSSRGRRSSPSTTSPIRWAPSTRSSEIIAMAHAAGAMVLDRRRPVGRPRPHRRSGSRLPTSTPSPATSFSAPPASACSTAKRQLLDAMPPYQGGGDMIASVTFDKTDLRRPAQQVRGRHAQHRRRRRPGRRHRLPAPPRPRQPSPLTKHGLLRYATARLPQVPGLRIVGTAAQQERRDLLRDRKPPSPPSTSACSSTRRHRRPHRPPLLPCR